MYSKTECIAMILAGGRGERMGSLTRKYPKPVVSFGGGYRIIDFTLNNCLQSGIDTVGMLSQYKAEQLHEYIDSLVFDELSPMNIHTLPPKESVYIGTADAIYQNMEFIDGFSPRNVLVLSCDHIYNMDYNKMLFRHLRTNASLTIASTAVDWADTSRYGIISTDSNMQVTAFEEKPAKAKSNFASMGIYIFKWEMLKRYLTEDHDNDKSCHDFGKNIIPAMLGGGEKVVTHPFDGYWRDVGNVESLWHANMDYLNEIFMIPSNKWEIRSANNISAPTLISPSAKVLESVIGNGSRIMGDVSYSVISGSVVIEEGAQVSDSVIMSNVYIGKDARINKAVIDSGAQIMEGVTIDPNYVEPTDGISCQGGVCLVPSKVIYAKHQGLSVMAASDIFDAKSKFAIV